MPVCVESMTYAATQVNLMFSVWYVMGVLCGIFVGHETPSVDLRSKLAACGKYEMYATTFLHVFACAYLKYITVEFNSTSLFCFTGLAYRQT